MYPNKIKFNRLNKVIKEEGVEMSSTMSSTTNDTEIDQEWSSVPKIEAKFSALVNKFLQENDLHLGK